MIRLLLEPVNFLILDEPTNHLDLQSKEVLKNAVKEFDGTLIVVSHDRDFLDGLVNRVYEFADGKVREHLGGIYDFLEQKRKENEGMSGLSNNVNARGEQTIRKMAEAKPAEPARSGNARSYEQQKEAARILRKKEKRVKDAEALVEKLETQLASIEEKLATPEGAADSSLFSNHAFVKAQLTEAETEWEAAMMDLE